MKFRLFFFIFFCSANISYAQRPPCGPSPTAGETACTATPICDFNGYCGTTKNYAPNAWTQLSNAICTASNSWLGCITIENDSYLKFIASTTTISLGVYVFGCTSSSKSIQIAVFTAASCSSGPVNIVYTTNVVGISQSSYSNTPFNITINGLTVGQTYYVMIDGESGAKCDYLFVANNGVAVVSAGPDVQICPGTSATLNASGSSGSVYTWYDLSGNAVGSGATYTTPPLSANTSFYVETTNGFCPNIRDTVNVMINCPLPVDFLDFTGTCHNSEVILDWFTGSEINNSHFTLYRADNSLLFEPIITIPGGGYKTNVQHYQFKDAKPLNGINYYKLTQTDFNGLTTELKTIPVFHNCTNKLPMTFQAFLINNDQLILIHHFNLNDDVLLELTDASGKLVFEQTLRVDNKNDKEGIPLKRQLSSGVYFLRALASGVTYSAKVIAY